MFSRREWLRVSLTGSSAAFLTRPIVFGRMAAVPITVYKSPSCGCCKEWVKHMEANGFAVTTRDMEDLTEVKRSMGVPRWLEACHTALVGRYVVEGHIPATVVKRMLKERPTVAGIAVPGMPAGSPGMETAAVSKGHFEVIAFERNGKTRVFANV